MKVVVAVAIDSVNLDHVAIGRVAKIRQSNRQFKTRRHGRCRRLIRSTGSTHDAATVVIVEPKCGWRTQERSCPRTVSKNRPTLDGRAST